MLESMDAVFLDSIAKLIEIDTSDIFFGHPRKFHSVLMTFREFWETYWRQKIILITIQLSCYMFNYFPSTTLWRHWWKLLWRGIHQDLNTLRKKFNPPVYLFWAKNQKFLLCRKNLDLKITKFRLRQSQSYTSKYFNINIHKI